MKNYINKKFSLENTPETSNKWKKMVEKERIISEIKRKVLKLLQSI